MATKTNYHPLAADLIKALGGPDNIRTVAHCATRLRFKLRNADEVAEADIENHEQVIALVKAGGQHQVVIGNEVPLAYNAVIAVEGMGAKGVKEGAQGGSEEAEENEDGGSLVNRFVDLISSIFSPILWCIAGIALLKAVLSMSVQFAWLDPEGVNYAVLNAIGDGVFYFLPLFITITAARKFKVNEYIALAVVAPLLHPSVVALTDLEGPVRLFGLPFVSMNYTASVIPAIFAVWLTGYLQRWLEKILPGAIRNFGTPLFCVLIMVPLVLFSIGPATMIAAGGVSSAVAWVFEVAPWLAGALMGAFWQVLAIFGMHWGFAPLFLNDLATTGISYTMAPLMAAVLSQGAAVLAVAVRTRNVQRRKLASPAAISALVAGVTEPAIYGVNLPLKVPFYAGCVGGAVGGAIIGISGSAFNSFVFASFLAVPGLLGHGNFALAMIGTGVAMLIGFVGTFVLLPGAEKKADASASANAASANAASSNKIDVPAGTTAVLLPMKGEVLPLDQVNDEVFASGAMGAGLGIIPTDGEVISPVSGTVIAAPKSGHAYGIKTADGIEVLVHIGLDTVSLRGEGFDPHVAKGDVVEAGQPLVTADLAAIKKAGLDPTTILVITNSAKLTDIRVVARNVASLAGEAGLLVQA